MADTHTNQRPNVAETDDPILQTLDKPKTQCSRDR